MPADVDILNRLAALERRIRNGLTLAALKITGTLTLSNGTVLSDTYTPTLTNDTNIDASTAYEWQYARIGNTVIVSGKVDIDPTAAASTATRLDCTLPIASNFGAAEDAGGAGYATGVVSLGFAVVAEPTGDKLRFTFLSTTTANTTFHFCAMYQVI